MTTTNYILDMNGISAGVRAIPANIAYIYLDQQPDEWLLQIDAVSGEGVETQFYVTLTGDDLRTVSIGIHHPPPDLDPSGIAKGIFETLVRDNLCELDELRRESCLSSDQHTSGDPE